jgi:hypothetical protein
MFEVSESKHKPVEWQTSVKIGDQQHPSIVLETLQGAVNVQLLEDSDEIVSIFYRRCVHPSGVQCAKLNSHAHPG